MDLRNLPDGLSPKQRCDERRRLMEKELGTDLSCMQEIEERIGHADEKNCEQMFGTVPLPVGYAGPLSLTLSSGEKTIVHLPLATTEGALVASVNRGCKALSETNIYTGSQYHGITRSIAFAITGYEGEDSDDNIDYGVRLFIAELENRAAEWKEIAESTSSHLKFLNHEIAQWDTTVFLTLSCDTDEAMGMNMVTIAAQAVADWVVEELASHSPRLLTVAGNVDSDKKPSKRTHDEGRGYEATAEVLLPAVVITNILKSSAEDMAAVADAKLRKGSTIAEALGANLHAANSIAALYLATGQDAAHVVEGSLTDTIVELKGEDLLVRVRLPAVLVGVRGGGTALPAQRQCLQLLLKHESQLHPCAQLSETIAAAVLAGEVSLLAAQASNSLASAHKKHAR